MQAIKEQWCKLIPANSFYPLSTIHKQEDGFSCGFYSFTFTRLFIDTYKRTQDVNQAITTATEQTTHSFVFQNFDQYILPRFRVWRATSKDSVDEREVIDVDQEDSEEGLLTNRDDILKHIILNGGVSADTITEAFRSWNNNIPVTLVTDKTPLDATIFNDKIHVLLFLSGITPTAVAPPTTAPTTNPQRLIIHENPISGQIKRKQGDSGDMDTLARKQSPLKKLRTDAHRTDALQKQEPMEEKLNTALEQIRLLKKQNATLQARILILESCQTAPLETLDDCLCHAGKLMRTTLQQYMDEQACSTDKHIENLKKFSFDQFLNDASATGMIGFVSGLTTLTREELLQVNQNKGYKCIASMCLSVMCRLVRQK
jgi:hypothetical protein